MFRCKHQRAVEFPSKLVLLLKIIYVSKRAYFHKLFHDLSKKIVGHNNNL